MTTRKYFSLTVFSVFVVALMQITAMGQEIANMSSNGSSVRFDLKASSAGGTMTVAAPDGRIFRQEFKAGSAPELMLTDNRGERLPDGAYTYEIRLNPDLSPSAKEKLKAMRGKDDEPEAVRATRKRAVVVTPVESGSFSMVNGAAIVRGAIEEDARPVSKVPAPMRLTGAPSAAANKLRRHHLAPMPDQVIPDDLIVQGSLCAGFDCVNNESFGFDTIRMSENNTRLQFNDTSVGSFPSNNWQVRANSADSGGQSFLGFVDQGTNGTSEGGTIVFEVDAGAPSNALRVASSGNVGLSTATPVLDLHIFNGNTPAIRLEQVGGFGSQTWDIAANEANFFVRDITSGSRLPFRIRPGAPTSSIDISASGFVGIGTASPSDELTMFSTGTVDLKLVTTATGGTTTDGFNFSVENATQDAFINQRENANLRFFVNGAERVTYLPNGRVGIATPAPDQTLSVNGGASKTGGGSWSVFSDRRLKNIKGNFNSGLSALMQLQPLRFEYKPDNALGLKAEGEQVGFEAQTLQKIIPAAVTQSDGGYLMVNNDPIIFTMLNAIKEQQQQIEELKNEVRKLQKASKQ